MANIKTVTRKVLELEGNWPYEIAIYLRTVLRLLFIIFVTPYMLFFRFIIMWLYSLSNQAQVTSHNSNIHQRLVVESPFLKYIFPNT